MKGPHIDPLREKLAPVEIERARALLAESGVGAVIARADERVMEALAARARFEKLAAALESADANETRRLVQEYLFEAETDPKAQRSIARALSRKDRRVFDLPALAERLARRTNALELEAEVTLAIARAAMSAPTAQGLPAAPIVRLARTPGRWSRRVEALRSIQRLAAWVPQGAERDALLATTRDLTSPAEERWVQSAAIHALSALAPEEAVARASERLVHPGDGDDFLVRERLVDSAGRLRAPAWRPVLELGARDRSEHVRLAATRGERRVEHLLRLAKDDASERVRASALGSLARREGPEAEAWLLTAIRRDPSSLVVGIALEEIRHLARKKRLRGRDPVFAALAFAEARAELDDDTRRRAADASAVVLVMIDPYTSLLLETLAPIVKDAPVGGGVRVISTVVAAASDPQLGRVLSVLAQDDFALGADRIDGGLVLYRGDHRRIAPWRVLFEARTPSPSKRQGFLHTTGRAPRGVLRAPSGGLAELTATRVPGERVLGARGGDWGRQVPLVDDLLGSLRQTTAIVGPAGTTWIAPPTGALAKARAFAQLTLRYAELADLRRRALDASEQAIQEAYAREVHARTGIALRFEPERFGTETLTPPPQLTERAGALGLAPLLAPGLLRDFADYTLSGQGNRLPHVTAYAAIVLAGFFARTVVTRLRINADRRAVPLVLGGWGTRGKSGTERIKAGMLQGLGYECLVKTTGCEAMFIHAIPGVAAREVFIYRPYDKATVWEQRALLELARRFGAKAFLWECMALQPDLVNLLQAQWMRDDYSTITNAYPDHEDVQGPAGYDVAECISEFVPTHGRLFTSEDQMLPILREQARSRGTSLRAVTPRDAALLGEDLLARFPYHEHPRNIALVAALGQAFGIPTSVAIAEMADHVVPNLGVLKTYPTLSIEGRTLDFTNGMSANERTGALSNWRRMGFDRLEPSAFVVTVTNNRADRVARSEVFARFLVEDIGAHRHVLIGTNVSGLLGYLDEALTRHLAAIAPSRELGGDAEARIATATARIDTAFRRLMIFATDAEDASRELTTLGVPASPGLLEPMLTASIETYEDAKQAVTQALAPTGPNAEHAIAAIAKRRLVRAVRAHATKHVLNRPSEVDAHFAKAYRALFFATIIPLRDPSLTGDQVLTQIAQTIPSGLHARVMGLQNIKGTGLDFVYRWVSADLVTRALTRLEHPAQREAALRELLVHDDYGLYDAKLALEGVSRTRDRSTAQAPFEPVITRLETVIRTSENALAAERRPSLTGTLRRFIGKTFDFADAIHRRTMASKITEDLLAERISHATAAVAMREVVARAKGAWIDS